MTFVRGSGDHSVRKVSGSAVEDHLFILLTYYICYDMRASVRGHLVRHESVGKYDMRAWVMYDIMYC